MATQLQAVVRWNEISSAAGSCAVAGVQYAVGLRLCNARELDSCSGAARSKWVIKTVVYVIQQRTI